MTLTRRTKFLVGAASLTFIVMYAVLPALRTVASDFSNYYIPSRLVARGLPTDDLYDFSWFQRQMDYAGIESQSGGFNRFPPPAGLVMLPLGFLEPLAAKRVWTFLNVGALVGLLALLARMGGLPFYLGLLLAALSGAAIRNNFIYGQFYVVLALLVAGAFYFRGRGRPVASGVLLGVGTAIKLYPAPLLLYFAIRREWRVVAGFVVAVVLSFAASTFAFGWDVNVHFLTGVLGPSLAGLTDNPFHPALQSYTSLLRRVLVLEPTLNPTPLVDAPFLFFFFKNLFLLGVLGAFFWILRKREDLHFESLLVLALLLVSTTLLSYHVFLALVPVALALPRLFRDRRVAKSAAVLLLFVVAGAGSILYLRFIALAALAFVLAWDLRPLALPRSPQPRVVGGSPELIRDGGGAPSHEGKGAPTTYTWSLAPGVVLAAILAFFSVVRVEEDGAKPIRWDGARLESPAFHAGSLVYSALSRESYRLAGDVPEGLSLPGNAFAPSFARSGGALFFEATLYRTSRVFRYQAGDLEDWTPHDKSCSHPAPSWDGNWAVASCDGDLYLLTPSGKSVQLTATPWEETEPTLSSDSADSARVTFASRQDGRLRLFEMDLVTRGARPLTLGESPERGPRYSPDGTHVAFSRRTNGSSDIFVLDLASGREWRVTRDPGNDTEPSWSEDGKKLYFASDRGRGIFMPAIYSLDIPFCGVGPHPHAGWAQGCPENL